MSRLRWDYVSHYLSSPLTDRLSAISPGGICILHFLSLFSSETWSREMAGVHASKKSANRRQRGAQKACSNVFSMFEQSQIQEFKELNVNDEELEGMLSEGKGPINFTVFLSLFGEKLNGTDPEDTILAAFKLFDPNATGSINKDEFRRLLMNQADKFTGEEVDQAFAVAPIDVAGNLDYKSLCYIITHGDEKEDS
ncbi:hypothetical protein NHX12_029328 [Muraenolepis orangiensis]|uniref:EF-hand domain-containing protein n=1 Tax=Muraenolepis orangiensis TaxID=630683 RepID=A0A9Q0INJ2_9TELE|nr:hypothetical protein NHX12_029328 [Muraenolepis orangiensis]